MIFVPNEILFDIFTELYEMDLSLINCIKVSRLWANIAIPILWQDLFKYYEINKYIYKSTHKQTESLRYIFYQSLNEKERLILKNNLIFKDWMNIPIIFPYIKFIRK